MINFRRTRWATYLSAAAILLTLGNIQGASAAELPAVALICDQRNELPWIDVVEVALASDARIRLVDREHLGKVLEEQKLAMLIGPADGAARIRVGRLVGCDLLIIVRHEAPPQDTVRVVIADTRTGIRLVTAEFPAKHAAEKRQLPPALLTAALTKRAITQPIVLAIPPFANDDLSRSNQYLQDSLAAVCETVAARYPQILFVELEEAREIAKENILTAREASRVLPHYLLGRFRLESSNKEQPPSAVLRLERGDTLFAEKKHDSPTPANIGAVVQNFASELLSALADKKGDAQVDDAADAAKLAAQALELIKVSDYEQGARLAEASLLLRPDQLDLRHTLRNVYKDLAHLQYDDPRMERQRFDRQFQKAMFYAERNMEHLRIYLGAINTRYTGNPSGVNVWEFDRHNRSAVGIRDAIVKHHRDYSRMLIEAIELKIRRGQKTGDMSTLLPAALGYYNKKEDGTQNQFLTDRLPLLRIVEGTPQQRRQFYSDILTWGIATYDADAFAFYESLFTATDPELVTAAKHAKEEGEYRMGIRKRVLPPVQPPPVATRSDVSVRLTPVELSYVRNDGRQTPVKFQGVLSDGREHDIAWGFTDTRVVLHRSGGESFRKIFEADLLHDFGHGCYDGKYVWLPLSGPDAAHVLRIDSATGAIVSVGGEQGLPAMEAKFSRAVAAPLEPGKIVLVASFGLHKARRAFVAEISGSETAPPRVRVVHESREENLAVGRLATIENADTNVNLAYTPMFVLPLRDHGSAPPTRILIARTVVGNPYHVNSLIVDLATGKTTITAAAPHSHLSPNDFIIRDVAAYWTSYRGVWRISPADFTQRQSLAKIDEDEGALYFTQDGVLIIGRECWFTEDLSKPFKQVPDDAEKFFQTFLNSSHFSGRWGTLLYAQPGGYSNPAKLHRVEIVRKSGSAQ